MQKENWCEKNPLITASTHSKFKNVTAHFKSVDIQGENDMRTDYETQK